MTTLTLTTPRLLLRPWRDSDREPFAALNADPVVMEHFQAPLSRAGSDEFVDRIADRFATSGWGLWAVEVVDGAPFIGYVGLWPADYVEEGTSDEPSGESTCVTVEVGWRLARGAWGHGYAPEAAIEAMRFGFGEVGLGEIVSFTVPQNRNSRRVMEKIGLQRRPDRDFDHPRVDPVAHPHLVRHVLYAVDRAHWSGGVTPR